jgi:uncharacterized cupin superfamily protein
MAIANLDEGPTYELAIGHIKGLWRDFGRQIGTRTVGLRRIEIAEDRFSTPAHDHGADEEIFFVLAGEGLLWQEGKTCAVSGGDCIVHRPRRGAHTLRGGAGGLDVLVFGQRRDPVLPSGGQGAPAHCHSQEEEIFVILEGGGVWELWGRGSPAPDEHPLRAGDVVSRPAGTGVAHALRAGTDGLTYLAYGTREHSDMCFYPQSGRVSIRGLGIALRSPEIELLPDL